MSKVFVVGATGVLGRRAVRDLVKAGHDVTAVARTPAKAEMLRDMGATPLGVNVFDPAAVKDAVSGHEVVANLATHIPPMWKMMLPRAWDENDRIRREVSRNLVDALAGAVGVRRVTFPPAVGVKMLGKSAGLLSRSLRVSNAKFKEATGWQPAYPSGRQGWPAVVRQMGQTPKVSLLARILLLLLLIPGLELGLWATFAPQSFFNSFPGGGRHWVAVDGPFNEHLVRDFGAMNLGLALVLIVALVVGSRLLVTTAAGAALLFAVPHLLYHLFNLNVFSSGDKIANVVSLGITVVLPIAVIWAAQRTSVASSSRASVGSP